MNHGKSSNSIFRSDYLQYRTSVASEYQGLALGRLNWLFGCTASRMCPYSCGVLIDPSQPIERWTCPCGLGYWNQAKKEFITGDRVRTGEAPKREDYETHLRQCSECCAQAESDNLIPFYSGDRLGKQCLLSKEGIGVEVIKKHLGSFLASVISGNNQNCFKNSHCLQGEKDSPSLQTDGFMIYANTAPTTVSLL